MNTPANTAQSAPRPDRPGEIIASIEWLVVTGDTVHARIRGLPLQPAHRAARALFPEYESTLHLASRLSATPFQKRAAERAPVLTPAACRRAGIEAWRSGRPRVRSAGGR